MPDLARVRRAAKRRAASEGEWRAAILAAHAEGASLRSIAGAAGVTNPRIHQIIHAATPN